jgi:hypothetical protein
MIIPAFIAVVLTMCVLIVITCTILYVCTRIVQRADERDCDDLIFGIAVVFDAAVICATLGVVVKITGPIYRFFLGG